MVDIFGWAEAAEAFARANNVNLSRFTRRVFMLPPMPACAWAGLATQGCAGGALGAGGPKYTKRKGQENGAFVCFIE